MWLYDGSMYFRFVCSCVLNCFFNVVDRFDKLLLLMGLRKVVLVFLIKFWILDFFEWVIFGFVVVLMVSGVI